MMLLLLSSLASALSLEEAWQKAGAEGHETALIEEQRFQSGLMRGQALAALSPKVSLTGNWTLNQRETTLDFASNFPQEIVDMITQFTGSAPDFGEPTVINKKQYFDMNLSIVQPIFSGRAFPGLLSANRMVDAAEAQEIASKAQLKLGISRAYWGVLVAREGEKVAESSIQVAERQVKTAEALVGVGNANQATLLQAKIALSRAQRDLSAARGRRIQAEQAFANLTGLSADVELEVPTLPSLPYQSLEDALERAQQERPDLQVARQQELAARWQQTGSVLAWAPDINARFTEVLTQNTGFSGEKDAWMFVITGSWTLWDGGFRIVEGQRASSVLRQAQEARAKAEEDAALAVQVAWEERIRAADALEAVKAELSWAEENLRLAELSLAAGTLSVLDAESARLGRDGARTSLVVEKMNLDIATRSLLLATGDF
jgi:outer membrane protein TolC